MVPCNSDFYLYTNKCSKVDSAYYRGVILNPYLEKTFSSIINERNRYYISQMTIFEIEDS